MVSNKMSIKISPISNKISKFSALETNEQVEAPSNVVYVRSGGPNCDVEWGSNSGCKKRLKIVIRSPLGVLRLIITLSKHVRIGLAELKEAKLVCSDLA